MKQLLKIPAVLLMGSALYTLITYDAYINPYRLFPLLNEGAFKHFVNFFLFSIQGALGMFLWQLSREGINFGREKRNPPYE